jgi:hypothetical protein
VHLLVVVLHQEELLDEVLTLLVEHGHQDAVVLDARSGLELLERDLPIFAGLRSLIPAGGIDFCRLLLCAIERSDGEAVLREIARLERPDLAGRVNTALLLPLQSILHF